MRLNSVKHFAVLAVLFALTAATNGCDKKDTINVTSVEQPATNFPPTIITQGPGYTATPIEVMVYENPPSLYLLVGDRNGLDDISVALFSVDTVIVNRIIARPAMSPSGCRELTFTDNDTVALSLPFPLVLTGVKNCAVESKSGGYFLLSPFALEGSFGQCQAFPGLQRLSSAFAPQTSGCTTGGPYYAAITYHPPTGSPVDIFITHVDVEYRGISVTVYDAAGASAVAVFPKLHVVHTSREEKTTAP